jgi:hypothetical protein
MTNKNKPPPFLGAPHCMGVPNEENCSWEPSAPTWWRTFPKWEAGHGDPNKCRSWWPKGRHGDSLPVQLLLCQAVHVQGIFANSDGNRVSNTDVQHGWRLQYCSRRCPMGLTGGWHWPANHHHFHLLLPCVGFFGNIGWRHMYNLHTFQYKWETHVSCVPRWTTGSGENWTPS